MKHIRNKFGDIMYCIRDDGTITDKFDCEIIGHLKGDRITDKFDIDTLYRIRQDGTITDKYDCNIIGHIREDGNITDKYDIDRHGKIDGFNSSSDSSDTGCVGSFFSLLGLLLMGILKILWFIFKLIFVYYCIPTYASMTWLMFLPAIFIPIGIPYLDIASAIASGLCYVAFWPYGIMLIIYKIKKQITTKELLGFYGKWFLKGPFAYKDLSVLKKNLNSN